MRNPKYKARLFLTIFFILIIFAILTLTMLIVVSIIYYLIQENVITEFGLTSVLLINAIASIVVGTLIALAASGIPVKPIGTLIDGMNRLAGGDYSTKISLGNKKIKVRNDLETSFNTLASELQNTEVLRSDFINNFSHEFKTPIVSIRGFAKLLLKGNLSEEKQQQYLKIIFEESNRLADMATNVLDLTKVENQNILTDITHFNLSEQIRNSILLLEKKWSNKDLEINAVFDEHMINANEEMLKHVWINLIDNAIKFSIKNSHIDITIKRTENVLVTSITNYGEDIKSEEQTHIFKKFYQADKSHASEGNGIGLAIVKKVMDLHEGDITLTSKNGTTTFTVTLPVNIM